VERKIWLSWSTGKDSAFTLFELSKNSDYKVVGLLTTVTGEFDRVSMHATRTALLRLQADRLKIPLHTVTIPSPCSNDVYEAKMSDAIESAVAMGISHIAFGDLFLEDVRKYREKMLSETKMEPLFSIWGRPTHQLAKEMIDSGHKAIVTCVDTKQLSKDFIGREFDQQFLNDLPKGVDPCGENGEFHTFVYDSPLFSEPIDVKIGEQVKKDQFLFVDVELIS